MNYSANDSSRAMKQDARNDKFHHVIRNSGTVRSSMGEPANTWDAPTFEEFDLCMEVTTYIQHWE